MHKKIRKLGFKECKFHTGIVEINYIVGPNNGPALILIPGQSLSLESYYRSLPLLMKRFHIFAVDVRGHGKSGWTPGEYTFPNMGEDISILLTKIIKKPAFISGNSSGGLIAMWVAANRPDFVSGIILEDAPVFSAEWPRLKDDCYIYRLFKKISQTIGSTKGRDLAGFFKGMEVPFEGKQHVMKFPNWFTGILVLIIHLYQYFNPDKPVDIPLLPAVMRLWVKNLSIYDPEFTNAFVDGSACRGFDHEETLKRIKCPILLMHANWFKHLEFGLVGSMDDSDIEHIRSLIPNLQYKRITSGHMIHFENPKQFTKEVISFTNTIKINDKDKGT